MLSTLFALGWIFGTLGVVILLIFITNKYGLSSLVSLYVALYVISAVLANKMIIVIGAAVPAGTIVFSITFLMTDIISEFYGKDSARKAVWLGLIGQVLLLLCVVTSIAWPSAPFWKGQNAFEQTLGNTWRIVIATLFAYIISQNHDVWAYHYWKNIFKGKHLWFRNNASTIVSQFLDTIVFSTIAFWGIIPLKPVILGTFTVKAIIALSDTPFLYITRNFITVKKDS